MAILSIPPLIPAGILEFRGIPGIPEDSGRTRQESNWNRQRICLFKLYLLPNKVIALNLLLIYASQDPYTPPFVMQSASLLFYAMLRILYYEFLIQLRFKHVHLMCIFTETT